MDFSSSRKHSQNEAVIAFQQVEICNRSLILSSSSAPARIASHLLVRHVLSSSPLTEWRLKWRSWMNSELVIKTTAGIWSQTRKISHSPRFFFLFSYCCVQLKQTPSCQNRMWLIKAGNSRKNTLQKFNLVFFVLPIATQFWNSDMSLWIRFWEQLDWVRNSFISTVRHFPIHH